MRPGRLRPATAAVLAAALAAASGARAAEVPPPRACVVADPTTIALAPTGPEVTGSGEVVLRMADSPYGVALTADGRYRTRLTVRLEGLPAREGTTYVAWAATPSLDEVARLGTVEAGAAAIEATVSWNRFLVFVTAERDPDRSRWEGPILMTAMSPSGKMHPKAGHGIFEAYAWLC